MQCNSLCRVIVLNSSSYHYFSLESFERHFFKIKSQLCNSTSKSISQSVTFSINQSISKPIIMHATFRLLALFRLLPTVSCFVPLISCLLSPCPRLPDPLSFQPFFLSGPHFEAGLNWGRVEPPLH